MTFGRDNQQALRDWLTYQYATARRELTGLYILSLDPGGQTGFALTVIRPGENVGRLVAWGQFDGADIAMYHELVRISSVVVCEKFMDMGGPTDKQAMEIVGYVVMACHCEEVAYKGALPVARFFIEKRLPTLLGLKPTGPHSETHRWDAFLHGATYAWSTEKVRSFVIDDVTYQ